LLQNAILTQMMALKEKDRASTSATTQCFALPESQNGKSNFNTDPRFTSWMGGSILAKIDSSREMLVTREKWGMPLQDYQSHLAEIETRVREEVRQKELEDEEGQKRLAEEDT
jgi:hypothetical protein